MMLILRSVRVACWVVLQLAIWGSVSIYSYSSDCQTLLYRSVGLSMTLVVSLVTSKNGHNSEMVSSTLRSLTYSTQ